MFSFNVPIHNKIETIICDLYLHTELKVYPKIPVQSNIGKQYLQDLECRLNSKCYEISAMVCDMFEKEIGEAQLQNQASAASKSGQRTTGEDMNAKQL